MLNHAYCSDKYQYTMGKSFYDCGMQNQTAVFNLFYRKAPENNNRAIDRMRTNPPPPVPLEDGLPAGGPSPEEELERRAFAGALLQAVEALPPPDNELVYRFYYEEERLRDIARDLGLSVPAAKSRLCRARRKLKAILIKGGLADGTA